MIQRKTLLLIILLSMITVCLDFIWPGMFFSQSDKSSCVDFLANNDNIRETFGNNLSITTFPNRGSKRRRWSNGERTTYGESNFKIIGDKKKGRISFSWKKDNDQFKAIKVSSREGLYKSRNIWPNLEPSKNSILQSNVWDFILGLCISGLCFLCFQSLNHKQKWIKIFFPFVYNSAKYYNAVKLLFFVAIVTSIIESILFLFGTLILF